MPNAPPPDAFQLMLRYCWGVCVSFFLLFLFFPQTYPRGRDDVRVPGAVRHLYILYAVLLLGGRSIDMTGLPGSMRTA